MTTPGTLSAPEEAMEGLTSHPAPGGCSVTMGLAQLNLMSVAMQGWLVIFRQTFDHSHNNEPFTALVLLYHPDTHEFICRVLGRTIDKGYLGASGSLQAKCQDFFVGTAPCLGAKAEKTDFPISCLFSESCGGLIQSERSPASCSACLNLAESAMVDRPDMDELLGEGPDILAKFEDDHMSDDPDDYPLVGIKTETEEAEDVVDLFAVKQERSTPTKSRRGRESKTSKDVVSCFMCFSTYSSNAQLRRHYAKEHPDYNKCDICQKDFKDKRSVNLHMKRKHFSGRFGCRICSEMFKFASDLTAHHMKSHPDESFEAECPCCQVILSLADNPKELDQHYEECTKEKQKLKVKKNKENSLSKRVNQCAECGKFCQTSTALKMHIQTHTGEKNYECQFCDFKTIYKVSMNFHNRRHLMDQGVIEKIICDLCGKEFRDKYNLKSHVLTIHEKTTVVHCDQCDRTFSCKKTLTTHKNRIHGQSNQFVCRDCGTRLGSNYELTVHMRTHSEPTFKCRFCGKMMKSAYSLQSHERIHTGENPFKCKLCEYACKSSATLSAHKKFVHNQGKRLSEHPLAEYDKDPTESV